MDPSGEEEKGGKKIGCMGDGELSVDGGCVMHFRNLNGILEISIRNGGLWHWVAVKPTPYHQEPEINSNIN